MEKKKFIHDLLDLITFHGDRGAIVPFSRINDLKKDMIKLKNGDFHTTWLDRMANHIKGKTENFVSSDIGFKPQSLISIIMPSPKVLLQFNYLGKLIYCIVPPHYTNWDFKNEQALQYLRNYLTPHKFSVSIVRTIPQKLLAVHCGLALYGRNNICYNDEFGSYMQIMTYISDLPCNESIWFPIRQMETCKKCHVCVSSCPTGAIDSNRTLINSDKCITLLNESSGDFPNWIKRDMHNSIIGCIKCQDCCPNNVKNSDNVKIGIVFTEEETIELLNHKIDESYIGSLASKIETVGIPQEYTNTDILPRNLAVLIKKHIDHIDR